MGNAVNIDLDTKKKQFKVHIGLDFGNDGCGLSFAYNEEVTIYNKWKTKRRKSVIKIPTQILLNGNDNIIAFGSKAKTMYFNLTGSERKEWKFIDKLKPLLQGNGLNTLHKDRKRETSEFVFVGAKVPTVSPWMINRFSNQISDTYKYSKRAVTRATSAASHNVCYYTGMHLDYNTQTRLTDQDFYVLATNGAKCSAEIVFVTVLEQIREIANEYVAKLSNDSIKIGRDDIQWIIAVPEIWRMDKVKPQIKEWMFAAGLIRTNDECIIVSESNCAALALYQDLRRVQPESEWPINACFIVIHTGSSTVDITCHQISNGLIIQRRHKPQNCFTNDAYIRLLAAIIGEELLNEFQSDSPNVFVEMMDNFESAKHSLYEHKSCDAHDVELPFEFVQFLHEKQCDLETKLDVIRQKEIGFFEGLFGRNLDECTPCYTNHDDDDELILIVSNDTLIIDIEIWKAMADVHVDRMMADVDEMLNVSTVKQDCKYIYLVGEMTYYAYYLHKMKSKYFEMAEIEVIVPRNPTLIVARGAAFHGIVDPLEQGKILSHSYGIRACFDDMNESKECYKVIMHKNQRVPIGHRTIIHIATNPNSDRTIIPILKSNKENPQFGNDTDDTQEIKTFQICHEKRHKEVTLELHFDNNKIVIYYYLSHTYDNRYDKKCEIVLVDVV
eukprot:29118_1